MQLADDFVETAVNSASLLAKHRKASTIDVKDVQLHLGKAFLSPFQCMYQLVRMYFIFNYVPFQSAIGTCGYPVLVMMKFVHLNEQL